MVVVFYISGHGFGHASRDIEVINVLCRQRPDVRVVVRTAVARWLFETSTSVPVDIQSIEADSGVAQIDSLRLDEDETARRAARFYADFESRVDAEAAVLRALDASVAVGDIPPLAFAAADRAGVASCALGNFTWDWIYGGYPQFERLAPAVIGIITASYARAGQALRLPFHGGFAPMAPVTRDIPLIARRSKRPRELTRRALGIGDGARVVLASFGGYGLRLPYEEIARNSPFTLIVTDHEAGEPTGTNGRLKRLTSGDLAARALRYEDLVAAADVVVSKPGYGIVSECIANGAALLYTSRGRFVEHDMFVAEMPRTLRCWYLPQKDLMAGRWDDAVEALLRQPDPPDRLATNGAEVAAEAILKLGIGT